MKNQWDERYARQEYIYGTEPNLFLAAQLSQIKPGRILFPAEGEGRNAVYAAQLGWLADAFDQSEEALKKAMQLAQNKSVELNYSIVDFDNWQPAVEMYDCIVLIFVHLPEALRIKTHASVIKALKPGGTLILEAFNIKQLAKTSGGPKTAELLYTTQQLQSDFAALDELNISETQTTLDEGTLHQGPAEVIQLTARKPFKQS